MTYQTILIHLQLGHPHAALLHLAARLADRFGAHIAGVAACEPVQALNAEGAANGLLIEDELDELQREMALAEQDFVAALGRFAVPRALHDEGMRRYGFHGLSYEFIAGRLPALLGAQAAAGRIVIAHLGAGASMCALLNGRSIATTMSLTPLDGLVMGTRCGAIDPGAVLYLLQEKRLTAAQVADLLYHDCGLLGVSGISANMQVLLASAAPAAAEAVDLFVYRVTRELGGLAAALGGIDAIVFTGGIGEHAAAIRQRVSDGAAWLGVNVDATANAGHGPRISHAGSTVSAWVIPTDEDDMILRHSRALLHPTRSRKASRAGIIGIDLMTPA